MRMAGLNDRCENFGVIFITQRTREMNQVITLVSETLGPADMLTIGFDLKEKKLVKDARIAVAGPELVLIDTDDFATPEYTAYAGVLKLLLDSIGIGTIEDRLSR